MPSTQNRDEILLAAALEMPADKRDAFLKGACLGDPASGERLKVLLAARDKPKPLQTSDVPIVDATPNLDPADAADEAVGKTFGRFKVVEKLGEGGYGAVYVAEQTEPVRRRVALKVIKLGMDTKQVVARFEAERQALALMDYPNIAKVLDAGSTDTGRPYFVMELVRGVKITDYCDQNKLTTNDRLDLFIHVCQAIQHAHQKGIIHRDIKPSNILVTLRDGIAVPKVIDFGIAKATEGRLTDATINTQLQQFSGTPAYMSPEQVETTSLDIDTRSDIYSLPERRQVETFRGHTAEITAVGNSPDGTRLASCAEDGTIRLWDPPPPAIQKLVPQVQLLAYSFWVGNPTFSPDSRWVAAGTTNEDVQIVDPSTRTGTCG